MDALSYHWRIHLEAFKHRHWFLGFLPTEMILRKAFRQLTFTGDDELATVSDTLTRCPPGCPFIRTIEYRISRRPVVQSDNGNPRLVTDFDILLGDISSYQNSTANNKIQGVNLILNTSAQGFGLPRDPVGNTVINPPTTTVDCVSHLQFEGYVRPEPMLRIASALVGLPSISLKVDEHMWDNRGRLQFRHTLGQTLGLLPASVRRINIDLINTDKSLDATSNLPEDLMEDGADGLAPTLRDTARHNGYESIAIRARRISQEYLWPQGTHDLDSVPLWPDLEAVYIHFEPRVSGGAVPADTIGGVLNTLFAAAGRAAQRMPKLLRMTILVTLEGAGTQFLQYLQNGPKGGPQLSVRVSEGHTFGDDISNSWRVPAQWPEGHKHSGGKGKKKNYHVTMAQAIGQ